MPVVINLKGNSGARGVLPEGAYVVRLTKFEHGESSVKKTPYVQPVYTLVEDAEDSLGNSWGKRKLFGDKMYLTPNALWRLKNFASTAGVELPDDEVEYESYAEFAAELTDLFEGDYTGEVEVDEYEKNGDTKEFNVVTSIS